MIKTTTPCIPQFQRDGHGAIVKHHSKPSEIPNFRCSLFHEQEICRALKMGSCNRTRYNHKESLWTGEGKGTSQDTHAYFAG